MRAAAVGRLELAVVAHDSSMTDEERQDVETIVDRPDPARDAHATHDYGARRAERFVTVY